MPKERIVLDTNKIIKLYNSGKSINELANIFNVSRPTITRRLKNSGIVVRGQTEANQLMMSKRTIEENLHNVRAAHNAVRGKPRPREQKLKTAISRQANFTGYRSPYERDIANELIKRNIEFVPQFAIDIYNIDFAIGDNIAFEVFGGGWHAYGRHRSRFNERSKKLFDCGYTIVMCWVGFNYRFSPSTIVDYLVSLDKILRSDPSTRCKHYMIRGDGKPTAVGSSNLDYIT
ncbi:helix-turn-helix domain-containing protein [Massilioclostridium coli]|uniref:helix-turn-helix domain-containing protein n=1 Tax=Massilioclostridium coli TaxID=1870991 RepID=UPI003B831486